MRVEARLTCKSCGATVMVTLRGDNTKMSPAAIGQRVLAVAQGKHDCPAVLAELEAHPERYYSDLRRGMEKKHEVDHLRSLKGNDGKPAH